MQHYSVSFATMLQIQQSCCMSSISYICIEIYVNKLSMHPHIYISFAVSLIKVFLFQWCVNVFCRQHFQIIFSVKMFDFQSQFNWNLFKVSCWQQARQQAIYLNQLWPRSLTSLGHNELTIIVCSIMNPCCIFFFNSVQFKKDLLQLLVGNSNNSSTIISMIID